MRATKVINEVNRKSLNPYSTGRYSVRAKELARTNFKAECIIGFKMLRGANILDAKEITELILL